MSRSQEEWNYERGEGRTKHRWNKDEAGFEPSHRGPVGKCHNSITEEVATELLRQGVVYYAPGTAEPEHVYAVYRGAIYEATTTTPGSSFHGYPWRGDQERGALPPRIEKALRQLAERAGYAKEFQAWLKQYG